MCGKRRLPGLGLLVDGWHLSVLLVCLTGGREESRGFRTHRLPGLAGCCGMVPLSGAAHIPQYPWWERAASGSPI